MIIKFIKIYLVVLLCLTGTLSKAGNNYQDWWWNPAQGGMGLNVGQQDSTVFVAWFIYGDDGKASFLTLGGTLNGNTLTGPLFRGTGPAPGPNYDPSKVQQTAVGTATLTFNSNTDASLNYSYDNKSGSLSLQRFSFANPNFNQTWSVINTYTNSGCDDPAMNGSETKGQTIQGKQGSGNQFTFKITNLDDPYSCTAVMNSQVSGSRVSATGSASCDDGSTGTINMEDLSVQSNYLTFAFSAKGGPGNAKGCVQSGHMAGVVKTSPLPVFDLKSARQKSVLQGFSKTFNVSGDCTGTFAITETPAAKTVWNGQSVYAVGTTEIVNLNNCRLGVSGTQTSMTYYDSNLVELAKLHSNGSFSDYAASPQPSFVKVGDTGSLGTWTHWNNASRSRKDETDVHTYIVEPDSPSSVMVNQIDRTYDENNVLQITTQLRFRLGAAGVMEWSTVTIDFANNGGRLIFK